MRVLVRGIFAIGCAGWLAWMVGRIATDQFAIVQYLHWIPTLLAMAITLACACALIASKHRWMRNTLWVLALVQFATLLWQDVAIGRAHAESELLNQPIVRIAHFNANWPGKQSLRLADAMARGVAGAFRGTAPDVLFISEYGALLGGEAIGAFSPRNAVGTSVGRFGVVSVVPIVEAVPIFDDGKSTAALVRFAAWQGNPSWSALLVDLPSDPWVPRLEALASMRARIDGMSLPSPQVIVGDFNTARGGYALHSFAPQMHHAFDEGGIGFGATYSRNWPLWHIDHILLAPEVCAKRYETIDLGIGRHRLQAAIIQFKK